MRLEYHFPGVGQFTVGTFRRDFKDFFGNTVFTPSLAQRRDVPNEGATTGPSTPGHTRCGDASATVRSGRLA